MRKVTWFEPTSGEDSTPIERTLTEAEAINQQRETARKARPGYEYKTDEEALDDFLIVHWATLSDE